MFPYENLELEPFETAIAALNPVVAVKVRSAAVHAALADVCVIHSLSLSFSQFTNEKSYCRGPEERSVYVDVNTRIQCVDTMLLLPHADKEQRAAFVRDERVLVVWSDDLDAIIPACRDLEDRLIKLLWRSRPIGIPGTPMAASSYAGSVASGHAGHHAGSAGAGGPLSAHGGSSEAGAQAGLLDDVNGALRSRRPAMSDLEKGPGSGFGGGVLTEEDEEEEEKELAASAGEGKRRWWLCGKRVRKESVAMRRRQDRARVEARGVRVIAPVYNGLAAGLAICEWRF